MYIDGFNLYEGLRHAKLFKRRWLDLWSFSGLLCHYATRQDRWDLCHVRYYTSRVREARGRQFAARQDTYISALTWHLREQDFAVRDGKYERRDALCKDCGDPVRCGKCKGDRPVRFFKEKRSDVNLAVDLITDCCSARVDRAIVVSGDSDLLPAISAVQQIYSVPVAIAMPPGRASNDMESRADRSIKIGREHLPQSVLLPPALKQGAYSAPDGWLPE